MKEVNEEPLAGFQHQQCLISTAEILPSTESYAKRSLWNPILGTPIPKIFGPSIYQEIQIL